MPSSPSERARTRSGAPLRSPLLALLLVALAAVGLVACSSDDDSSSTTTAKDATTTTADPADEELTVLGPFGRLYHRPAERPILMAATGSGLGPLLAILRELRAAGTAPPIRLYYGARSKTMPLADELDGLGADLGGFEERAGPY